MQNQEMLDEIFNPKQIELLIGDNNSNVFACGKNENSELTFKGYKYLTNPSGLSIDKKYKILDVAPGNEHTALLTEYGYVLIFGSTLHNKLGLEGTTVTNISTPKLLPLSTQEQIIQVVCGPYHTLALTSKDEVWGWGGTLHKKTGNNRDQRPSLIYGFGKVQIIKIGCGDFHSVALSNQGILFSWGGGGPNYNKGQTGHNTYDDVPFPRPIEFFKNSPVANFQCGGYHTVSIQGDGFVFSWGNGLHGQLGHGVFENSTIPKKIEFDDSLIIEQIACGDRHTFFRTQDGQLYSCGHNAHGQIGHKAQDNLNIPTLVKSLQNKFVENICCGASHSIALVNPNFVYTCGQNDHGQLGLGDQDKRFKFTLVEKLAQKNVTTIRAGGHHSWFIIDYEIPNVENYQPPSPCYSSPAQSQIEKQIPIKNYPKNFSQFNDISQQRSKSKDSQNIIVPSTNNKPSITISRSDQDEIINFKRSQDSLSQKNQFNKHSNLNINEPDMSDEDLLIDDDNYDGDIVDIQNQKNVFKNSLEENSSKDDDINLLQSQTNYNHTQLQDNKVPNKKFDKDPQSPDKNKKLKRPKSNNFLSSKNKKQSNKNSQNNSFSNPDIKKIPKNIPSTFQNKQPQDVKLPRPKNNIQDNKLTPLDLQKNTTFGLPKQPQQLSNRKSQDNQPIIRLPVDQKIPYYQSKQNDEQIQKKQKIWDQSAYYLLFVELDYNHKFILLNFKKEKEDLLIKKVEKSIELIRQYDPNLLKYFFVKYQDYWIKTEDQLLKKIMSCCYTNDGTKLTDQTYVLMLVQESNLFKQLTKSQNIEKSTIDNVYLMWPEDIDSDIKWKLLSRSYEILLDQVLDCVDSFTIYELRSNYYYQINQ